MAVTAAVSSLIFLSNLTRNYSKVNIDLKFEEIMLELEVIGSEFI